jgi:mono/diheme cytochrome c family protein
MVHTTQISPVRWLLSVAAAATLVAVLALVFILWRQLGVPAMPALSARSNPAPAADSALVARGAYLALAGNCAGCHSARGGKPYAGGRAIATPFGTVFAGNLTPDAQTGLGRWSADAFWRAMHHGQSRDGRLLVPAFPYDSYTQISRADSDALYAYLASLPAVSQVNRPHALRWPYSTQLALAAWRTLYFEPLAFAPDPAQSEEWNRGAYLVRGLGHCAACHSARDALGGPAGDLVGGQLPQPAWLAPSLRAESEAGVQHWDTARTVELLQRGTTAGASVMGPMAEVVFESTQHLSPADLHAMAIYLQALAPQPVSQPVFEPARGEQLALGEKVYAQSCADCHGKQGEGALGAYPALAGNRAVTQAWAGNTVLAVLGGGFAPATAGNPQPYGMAPYRTLLTDAEIAAVVTHLRQSWGNRASAVQPQDVQRLR